jgi:hypothetical protein
MFNVKKTTLENGLCRAMRCKSPAVNARLCQLHWVAWDTAGQPPLEPAAPSTALATTPAPDLSAEIKPQRFSAEKALALLSIAPLSTQAQLDWMGEARAEVRRQIEAVEQRRTAITKPLNEAKRSVDALFKPLQETLAACLKCTNDRLTAYAAGQRAAQDQALKQVELGARTESILAVAHGGGPALPASVVERSTWTFEVEDDTKVPPQFMCVDRSAVTIAVRQGVRDIPGIRIFQEHSIAARPGAV